jgi:hypothetical protein
MKTEEAKKHAEHPRPLISRAATAIIAIITLGLLRGISHHSHAARNPKPGALHNTRNSRPPSDPGPQYETRDANVRGVLISLAALLLTACVMSALVFVLTRHYERKGIRLDAMIPSRIENKLRNVPPEPRLQTSPREDMQQMLTRQDHYLDSYGWLNRSSGTVHVPIAFAMDQLLARGLPVRETTSATGNLTDAGYFARRPTEQSSGRVWSRMK